MVDVVIIGGGPAGLAAGIVLARNGVRTLLCERRVPPVDKACGEGVMPHGVAQLQELGVDLRRCMRRSFSGVRYHSRRKVSASGSFKYGQGLGIARQHLSRAMHDAARRHACLELRCGTAAEPLAVDSSGVLIRVGDENISARLLIGADGLHSRIRRWAGLDKTTKRARRWGIRQHYRQAPWSPYVEVFWAEGAEAYVTPLGDSLLGIATLWDAARYNPKSSCLSDTFPALAKQLGSAVPVGRPHAAGPMAQSVVSPVADGVLLLGDAAGYLDALTGEGISLALAEALSLERTVVPLLKGSSAKPLLKQTQLQVYALESASIRRPYYRLTSFALLLSRYPLLADKTISMFARHPSLFDRLLQPSRPVSINSVCSIPDPSRQ